MQTLTVLLFFVSISIAQAQSWYNSELVGQKFPGYVITNEGEKLTGQIVYQTPHGMINRVKFYDDKSPDKLIKFKAEELKAYFVKDMLWKAFEEKDALSLIKKDRVVKTFYLVITQGCIAIYESYTFGFIDNKVKRNQEGETINEISLNPVEKVELYLKKTEDKKMLSIGDPKFVFFAKGMSKYLADDPELAKKVKSKEKGYKRMHLYKIIDEYNENCENR